MPIAELLPLILLILAQAAEASQAQSLERRVYACPDWEAAVRLTDAERYSTKDEYLAACDGRNILEKIRYKSDGLSVVAYFYHPRKAAATKSPVIVFNRGSYVRGDVAPELVTMFNRLTKAGFSVVAPMYRGSDGGEGRDEMGGADLNDLMNIVPVLNQLESLDTRNVFLYGESRGGMMVFQAIREGFPARAAATFGAFTDLGDITSSAQGAAQAKAIWPDFEERRDEIISRRSAINWPERLGLPILLMHGSSDRGLSPSHTLLLAGELAKLKREFGVIVFPGGNHVLHEHRLERDRQAVEFFQRYRVK